MNNAWSLSRRTRRRGMWLSGAVGIVVLLVSMVSHTQPKPPQSVVVTAHALSAGAVLSAWDLMKETVPAPGLAGALSHRATLIGRSLAVPMMAHQTLVRADVAHTPMMEGLKTNEVGIMLPVSLASSDNVHPNDRVNVIWLGGGNAGASGSTSAGGTVSGSALATGLRVLSVLNQSGAPVAPAASGGGLNASTPSVVDVAVPISEAGLLATAAASGRFWLALNPWAGPQDATAVSSAPPAFSPSTGYHPSTFPSGASSNSTSLTHLTHPSKARRSKSRGARTPLSRRLRTSRSPKAAHHA